MLDIYKSLHVVVPGTSKRAWRRMAKPSVSERRWWNHQSSQCKTMHLYARVDIFRSQRGNRGNLPADELSYFKLVHLLNPVESGHLVATNDWVHSFSMARSSSLAP